MAEKETITVTKVNQYGVRIGDKQYNYSKKYSGESLEIGKSYEAEIFTSTTGAKYINAARPAQGLVSTTKPVSVDTADTIVVGENPLPRTSPLSQQEKDVRILTQGIVQAVVQSPFLTSSDSDRDFLDRVKRISGDLIAFVKEQK